MATDSLLPERFGPLAGLRVVCSGKLIAAPFAAQLAAQWGAEVIQVEPPGEGDIGYRHIGVRLPATDGKAPVSASFLQERRNELFVTLDFTKPRARELFLRLLGRTDLWIESSKPGTYDRWGLDDKTVMETNPRLVITHITAYGKSGDPDYAHRIAYDSTGQAFSGMMSQTGFPDPSPPSRAAPWTGDYLCAYFGLAASLAAVFRARASGEGQAIDLAHFEPLHHTLGGTMIEYFQEGVIRERSGNRAQSFQPLDTFRAKDGWVMLGALTKPDFSRLCLTIGLDPEDPRWIKAQHNLDSIEGIEFDAYIRGWVAERTAEEVNRLLNQASVACSRVMDARDIAENPQYRARAIHVEWEDEQVGRVKGIGVLPRFSRTPGKIWRGSARPGHDNQKVYSELLGLSRGEIEELTHEKII
jgi:crotonobetainyl-CoA:carnitine CoA-transferase CaiB-like acyl-CoA transferase